MKRPRASLPWKVGFGSAPAVGPCGRERQPLARRRNGMAGGYDVPFDSDRHLARSRRAAAPGGPVAGQRPGQPGPDPPPARRSLPFGSACPAAPSPRAPGWICPWRGSYAEPAAPGIDGEENMAERDGKDGGHRLYLEDLHAGQRFTSGEHALDAAQIKAFAAQYDPQPFHLDEEAARGSLFAGLAASGWHTAAITMRLLVEGGAPIAGGVIGAGGEISWPGPTRAGDILRVESEVLEVRPSRSRPDRGMVTLRSETRNQRDEIVQVLTAKLVVPRRRDG
jgi:acyl dehydratase